MAGRVLILGGSWFLGRSVVEAALREGWAVTTFRRGQSGDDVPGAEVIRGDRTSRADVERLATSGPWDLVVDTSGYVPHEVGMLARVLEPVAGLYVFVSSVSAYVGWPVEPLTEASALLDCPPDADATFGYDADPGPSVYGFTKAGSEAAVRGVFGDDRTTVLRPGVILGPREYVGRLPWWLRRIQRSGQVLAPGRPERVIQPVDVRDVAAFALRAPAGAYNVTGPRSTMETFLRACADVTDANHTQPPLDLVWITDEQWLVEQGIAQWTELPLWRTYRGTWDISSTAALGVGLRTRTLADTVRDTWSWMQSTDGAVFAHERASEQGISSEKEAAILGIWAARERDHCG